MNEPRQRGIMVYPMPENVCGPEARYALLLRADGEARMIHTEGVAYRVDQDKPWRYDDVQEGAGIWSVEQLINHAFDVPPVDLADWIRTFGARLESNFGQIARWYNETEEV